MRNSSPQVGAGLSMLVYLLSYALFIGLLYWFYSKLKKIERLLEQVRKKLDSAWRP